MTAPVCIVSAWPLLDIRRNALRSLIPPPRPQLSEWIEVRLDQAASKKQVVPTVTGKVYNHSKRMKEKRALLEGVAAELRRIIGTPAEAELRLVA